MMNFILGMTAGILGVCIIIALIVSIEENKKTNRLINKVKKDTNRIIVRQELIMNEMGLDLNKQRQS